MSDVEVKQHKNKVQYMKKQIKALLKLVDSAAWGSGQTVGHREHSVKPQTSRPSPCPTVVFLILASTQHVHLEYFAAVNVFPILLLPPLDSYSSCAGPLVSVIMVQGPLCSLLRGVPACFQRLTHIVRVSVTKYLSEGELKICTWCFTKING